MAGGSASSPREGRLGLGSSLFVFAYGTVAYALAFPHLPSASWGVATAVIGVATAVAMAVVVHRHRPPPLSSGETVYAALYGVFFPVVAVFVLFLAVGAANGVDAALDAIFDVDAPWLRTGAVVLFLLAIPMAASGGFTDTWKPELVDRDPGVPTGWARFDPGHPSRVPRRVVRFVVHTVALVGAVALVLALQSWWVSIGAAVVVAAVAQSVGPATATESVATSVADAKTALRELGYGIAPAGDAAASAAEQSSVYPLIQPVDFRAVQSSVELAVSVYDDQSGPVDWTTASRLVSAARTLHYSRNEAGGSPVLPVMVLVDAAPDPSLAAFAAGERLAIVSVETATGRTSTSGASTAPHLDDLGGALLKAMHRDDQRA